MNYIKHLTGVFLFMDNDNRLTPFHISLYMVLFRQWNNNRFKNPISIARDEVMKASKIGSVNTYTKVLKQLHQYQYIRYEPSFNPHIGSRIYLYTFENANGQTINTTDEIEMSPLLNIENNTNHSNQKNKNAQAQNFENQDEQMKESNANPEPNPNDIPPPMEHLIIYFNEKEFTATEAEKFYNYFQSNGWLVGGKAPMKDWKAAARNWMLNAKKFIKNGTKPTAQTTPSPGKLHTETRKNYEEPL
jgi:hypothetical protein